MLPNQLFYLIVDQPWRHAWTLPYNSSLSLRLVIKSCEFAPLTSAYCVRSRFMNRVNTILTKSKRGNCCIKSYVTDGNTALFFLHHIHYSKPTLTTACLRIPLHTLLRTFISVSLFVTFNLKIKTWMWINSDTENIFLKRFFLWIYSNDSCLLI